MILRWQRVSPSWNLDHMILIKKIRYTCTIKKEMSRIIVVQIKTKGINSHQEKKSDTRFRCMLCKSSFQVRNKEHIEKNNVTMYIFIEV